MSAIAGVFNYGSAEPKRAYDEGISLMGSLSRYPADDVRLWSSGRLFLGCHAQWVTPESIGEILPWYDGQRGLAITADAILDNREELANKLGVPLAELAELPDARLLLLAYAKWGEDMPRHLIGDFAFAIWDESEESLFGARDFTGNRTLYYNDNGARFAFCTTIAPLLPLEGVGEKLNETWIAEYLASPSRLETIDASSTVFGRIKQIPPSHCFTIRGGNLRMKRYGAFEHSRTLKLSSDEEYQEAFLDVFGKAVTSRLRTHKEAGSFLSGGLDSGTVVGLAARELRRRNKVLHTYSAIPLESGGAWTSKNRVADERPMISATVSHVGNIREKYLRFEDRSPLSEMDDWLETMEMPYKFIENSYWFGNIFEQAAKDGVGVLLNGARGNFTVSFGPALEYYAILLKRLRLVKLYREIYQYSRFKGIGRKRVLSFMKDRLFPAKIPSDERGALTGLISPELAARTGIFGKLIEAGIDLSGRRLPDMISARRDQFEQVHHWTNSGTSGTKLSLRHGVWYRDPTNDLRVVQFCLSVPLDQYVRDGMDRALIRRATQGLLPDEVRLNGKTRGIQGADGIARLAPSWPQFIREVEEMCGDDAMAEWLCMPVVRAAVSKYKEIPGPAAIYETDLTLLMRSLVLYRFVNRLKGGDLNEQRMDEAFVGSA
ncbi:asparagine synthase (glutamine-hydrolysing) [Cohnella sp. OV330]|uniref:asparagine synthase-related protein n=1 Tax=Cohnella sp. OV330 TaxID=1855288 RepID=UPI0008F39784|nr:asparagine synthase-related protein [Cohnella sp. OV330]SFA97261.1 asparagine synthase (glutamine-hydrolysing) [Cohnella sp. OV330]